MGLVFPIINLRNEHRTAQREPEIVVAVGRLARRTEEAGCIERVVSKIFVGASVQSVGARFGCVLDEATTGVSILRRVGCRDYFDFLNCFNRGSALLALLVSAGVSKRGSVKEVLCCPGLAT